MLDQADTVAIQPTAALECLEHHQCHCVPGYRWTCVRTYPQAERWAQANLRRSGYGTFLPMHEVMRQDRVVPSLVHRVSLPLFAGYLFVAHDPATSWGPIRDAPGVRDVIRTGNRVAYTRDGTVEALRRALDGAEGFPAARQRGEAWKACGAIVGVARGIFAGHQGVVVLAEEEAALVSILFLGELRQIALSWDSLEVRQ